MFQFVYYANLVLSFMLFGFFFFRKRRLGFGTSFIFPLVLLVFVSDVSEFIERDIYKIDSAVHFKVYAFLEFFILLYYFYNICEKALLPLYIVSGVIFSALFVYVCLGYEWNFSESLRTDSYLSAFELIVVYICSIHWFVRIFRYLPETSLLKLPDFYFVSGLIMYASGPLFLFLFSSIIIVSNPESFDEYWSINGFFNIVLKGFLIFGIWKIRK